MAATSEAAPVGLTAPADVDAPPDAPTPGVTRAARVVGVDIARALAIVGMFAVHVGPLDDTSVPGRLYALAHGRASLLFVLVAGIGVSLLAGSRRRTIGSARRTLWWRALLLLPLGLLLQLLDHGVNVILQGYALLFVVASLVLTLTDRWLLALAAAFATTGPALFLAGRLADPMRFDRSGIAWGDSTAEVVDGLVLSGPYPLVTWAAPLLVGMWLGRRDLADPRLARRLVGLGVPVALCALLIGHGASRLLDADGVGAQVVSVAPHSQMPLWLIGGVASAAAVLGMALLLGRRLARPLRPVAALGQLALTAYVVHLLALHAFADEARTGELVTGAAIVVIGAGVLAFAADRWRIHLGQGPLERFMRLPRRLVALDRSRAAA